MDSKSQPWSFSYVVSVQNRFSSRSVWLCASRVAPAEPKPREPRLGRAGLQSLVPVPVTDGSRNNWRSEEAPKCGLPAWLRRGKGNDTWKIPSHPQQEREMTWNQEKPRGRGISANCWWNKRKKQEGNDWVQEGYKIQAFIFTAVCDMMLNRLAHFAIC